ncbi:MAG: hypothetical protein EP329_04935 [Deltaproteobacteria bacterium]|nr:MAG: hypothetical protein EP329_04935 [Deltaproteobacteria bacterium]
MLVRTLIALTALTLPAVPACLQLGPDAAITDAAGADATTDDGFTDVALTVGALSIVAPLPTEAPRAATEPAAEAEADVLDGADAGALEPLADEPLAHWVSVFETRHGADAGPTDALTAPSTAVPAGWFGLVHDGDLVLADEAPESWWGGPAAFVQRGEDHGRYVIERAAREASLPDAQRSWLGREVRLFDRKGERCVARVDGFALRSELVDDNKNLWGDENPWNEAAPDRTAQDPDVAWADGGQMLLGALTTVRGDCAGAVFAVPVDRPTPAVLARAKADKRLEREALAAFRALPAWANAQTDYTTAIAETHEPGAAKTWDRYADARPVVERFRAAGGREVALVTADSVDGCGSPGAQLSAVFEVKRSGKALTLTPIYVQPWAPALTGFVDLDGDGILEGIGAGAPAPIHTLEPSDAPIRGAVEIPDRTDYGCPC